MKLLAFLLLLKVGLAMDLPEIGTVHSSSSDEMLDFGINRADFQESGNGKDPVVMERISNFSLDESQFKVIKDEDEDKELEIDVHCDRFLSAPKEHIQRIFEEIPLHDPENFAELTADPTCTPHFVSKCDLITNKQLEKIWKTQGRQGFLVLQKIKCLQRLKDYTLLEEKEKLEIIKDVPIVEWESWWNFTPETLLSILRHQGYASTMPCPPKPEFIGRYLVDEQWKKDLRAWQIFDATFLVAMLASPVEFKKFTDYFVFGMRFPKTFFGQLDKEELQLIPRWTVRCYQFIISLSGCGKKDVFAEDGIKVLFSELNVAANKIVTLTSDKKDIASQLQLARSMLLQIPAQISAACSNAFSPAFKTAKHFRAEIDMFPGKDDIWPMVGSLQKLYASARTTLYSKPALATRYRERCLVDQSKDMIEAFELDFIQISVRPEMHLKEVNAIENFIAAALADVKLQPGDAAQARVPLKVRSWLSITWLSGNRTLFKFVCDLLNKAWNSNGSTEELLIQLANQDPDFIECALGFVENPRRAVQLIMRETLDHDAVLEVKNVPYSEILSLPLDDPHFFKPSFDLLSKDENGDLNSLWFKIQFSNEQGVDGGGPGRNWANKMLFAWTDPKRNFLKVHQSYLVPDVYVHQEVFYALGRLIGKGLFLEAGLPFAFHPQFVQLIKEHLSGNPEGMEKIFNAWYEEEMKQLRQTKEMAETWEMEDIEDLALTAVECWRLTDDSGGSNIGVTVNAAAMKYCPIPYKRNEDKTFSYMNVEDFTSRHTPENPEKRKAFVPHVELAKLALPECIFKPKALSDVIGYVEQAKTAALTHFKVGIEQFLKGLDTFVAIDMFLFLNEKVLHAIFCPTIDIAIEDLMTAFKYDNAEDVHVLVMESDKLEGGWKAKVLDGGPAGPMMLVSDAFKYGLSRLTTEEIQNFLGQLTGSRAIGHGGFQPDQLTVAFAKERATQSLIESVCPVTPTGPVKSAKEFPFTVSCTRTVQMPLYKTLEEIVLAVAIVARASDEFPRM